jgi:hypothetical protein
MWAALGISIHLTRTESLSRFWPSIPTGRGRRLKSVPVWVRIPGGPRSVYVSWQHEAGPIYPGAIRGPSRTRVPVQPEDGILFESGVDTKGVRGLSHPLPYKGAKPPRCKR